MTRSKREIAYRTAGALILAAAVVPWAASGTAMAGGSPGNPSTCEAAGVDGSAIPKSDITYTGGNGSNWVKITAFDAKWSITGVVVNNSNGYETYTPDHAKDYNKLGDLPWNLSGPGKKVHGEWIKKPISSWFVCGVPKGTPTPCPTVTVTETEYVTEPPVTKTVTTPGPTKTVTEAGPTETVTEAGPTETVTETITEAGPTQVVTEKITITPDPITTTATVAGPETTVVQTIVVTPDPITTTAYSTIHVTDTVTEKVTEKVTDTVTEAGPTETVTETVTEAGPTETVTETVTESSTATATESATATETSTVLVSQTDSMQAVDPTDSSTEVAVLGTKAPGVAGGSGTPLALADTGADGMTTKLALSAVLLMIGFALFAAPELLGAARTTMGRRH